jgi:hypothetical protein
MLSREVYWAKQCSDADGPRMPPDFVVGKTSATGRQLIVPKSTIVFWCLPIQQELEDDTMLCGLGTRQSQRTVLSLTVQ